VTLPEFAAERQRLLRGACSAPQLSIGISCPKGAQQQARQPLLLLSIDGTDGQTDGRPTFA